jgi:HlyD family secretion protein
MSAGISYLPADRFLPLLLAALLLGCGRSSGDSAEKGEKGEAEETPAVEVRTVPAEQRTIEEVVHAIGRSEALPNRLVTLTPAVAGHIQEILVNVGVAIHRGDTIVRLDSVVATADVTEKEAQRDTLQAALELLVAAPRPEDRRALEIAVDRAKVGVTRAEAMLDRLRPLRARTEISEAQWFDAEQTLAEAKLQQQSAEAQLQLLLIGPRQEAVAEAKARLAAAQQTLAAARAHLALHDLRSPIDGVVDSLNCHPGQAIAPAAVVAEIIDSGKLYVTAWLPAGFAEKIKPGQTGRIGLGDGPVLAGTHDATAETPAAAETDAAAANEEPRAAIGKVVSVGRIVDPQTGNLPVRLLFNNAEGRIAVGQTVSLSIVVAQMEKVLAVPSTAVFDLGEGPLVIVVREGKAVHLHPESAVTHGGWTIITGTDLKPGEPVVVDGGFNLPEETPVKESAGRSAVAEAGR